MNTNKKIAQNWGLVGLLTFISRLIGYLRDVVVAYFFGASYQTDAFYVAFRIPNLLRRLFAEGSITVAFVPIFTEYLNSGYDEAKKALNSIFTVLFFVICIICGPGNYFFTFNRKAFCLRL